MRELQRQGSFKGAGAKAGMGPKTVRKYLGLKRLCSEVKPKHPWKNWENPLEQAWDDLRAVLEVNPELDDLLKRMGNYAEDFIFLIGKDRSLQFANVPRQTIVSCAQSEGVFDEFDPLDFSRALNEQIETVFKMGRPLSVEQSAGRPEDEIWLYTRLTPVRNESGVVQLVLGIAWDISERKRREKLLVDSRDEWLQAIDAMPQLMAVVGCDFRIRKANRTLAHHFGTSVQELQGRICHQSFGMECPSEFCPLQCSRPAGQEVANFVRIIEGCPFLVTVSPLAGESENTVGCVLVARELAGCTESAEVTKKNAEELKLVISRADYVIMMQDENGKYLSISALPGNIQLPEAVVGKTPFDFFELETAGEICERIRKAIRDGRDFTVNKELKLAGETFHVLDHIQLVRDAAGNVTSVMTTSRNITRRVDEGRDIASEARALTKREKEILQLISSGLTSSEIAEKLFISRKTAETHRSRIMQKLDIHKASALARYAVKAGLF